MVGSRDVISIETDSLNGRAWADPGSRDRGVGFRLVRTDHARSPEAGGYLPMEFEQLRIPGRRVEMGKYEVTQGQWTSVMGANPAHFSACGWDCPVESVSASDVEAFIGVLNRQEAAAGSPYRYRLPTAEEWLSAPWRGGERLDEIRPVGRERANAWGLHGMNGSVWEWTSSTFPNGRRIILSDGGPW